jgi:adenine deaminase
LLDQGHIDYLIRRAIELGLDPVTAIRIGTLNPAEYFRLHDRGAIAPGRRADLTVLDDLRTARASMVFRAGKLVARDGELLPYDRPQRPTFLRASMNVHWDKVNFKIEARGRKAHVIGAIPDQLITHHLIEDVTIENGEAVQDPGLDLLKIAVIDRHTHSGNYSIGFVKGIGLRKGAIASSVAHDHHNIVVIGADDQSMMTAARAVGDMHGGMSVALGAEVAARLPLPIAGLMSNQPIEIVRGQMDDLLRAAHDMGSNLHDPFMAMAFLALAVIPELKITDQGLVDVVKFQTIPLFVD